MFVLNFFKGFDSYGAKTGLHVGKYLSRERGRLITYTTPLGGFLSLINSLWFWSFFCWYLYLMFTYSNNTYSEDNHNI